MRTGGSQGVDRKAGEKETPCENRGLDRRKFRAQRSTERSRVKGKWDLSRAGRPGARHFGKGALWRALAAARKTCRNCATGLCEIGGTRAATARTGWKRSGWKSPEKSSNQSAALDEYDDLSFEARARISESRAGDADWESQKHESLELKGRQGSWELSRFHDAIADP